MRVIITFLLSALALKATYVVVSDTVRYASGAPIPSGAIYITPSSQFACSNGDQIYPSTLPPIPIVRGMFSVTLCSNSNATPPNTSYSVKIVPQGLTGTSTSVGGVQNETWVVTTTNPSHLPDVRTSPTPIPSFLINVSQIIAGPNGYCITSNGIIASWSPTCGGGGGGSFSAITAGTNTAALVMGAGGSLSSTGGGTIDANKISGTAIAGLSGVVAFATGIPSVVPGTSTNCVHVDATSAPCSSTGAALQSITATATFTLDGSVAATKTFAVSLQGNVTCTTFTNFIAGEVVLLSVTIDATPGRTITCPALTNLGSSLTDGSSQATGNYKQYFVAVSSSALDSGGSPMWCDNCSPSGIQIGTVSGGGSVTFQGAAGASNVIITVPNSNGAMCLSSGVLPCGIWTCQTSWGDGAAAVTTQTAVVLCTNTGGTTWTITSVFCYTNNNGSSTLTATNGTGTALLTGPITCSNTLPGAAGVQSGTTTIANGGAIKFTFTADTVSTSADISFTGTR